MNRDLTLVALALFTWGLGESAFISFQPLYLQELGASPVDIGVILSGFGIASTLAHIPAGFLADRIGRRPLMHAAWVLGVLATWIMALANSIPFFVIGILLYGITLFVLAPMNSYITAARGKWSVGRALTFSSASYSAGAIIGPMFGGALGEQFGFRSIFLAAACIFIVSTMFILPIRRQPVEARTPQEASRGLLKNTRYTQFVLIFFLSAFAMYLPQPLSPNYLQNQGHLSLAAIGQLYSISGLGIVTLNLILGQMESRLGFLIGQAAVGLFALFLWLGNGFPWFALGYFMLGGFRAARLMAIAHARSLVRPANMGLAYGLMETAGAIATILAPLLAGLIYSYRPVWVYMLSASLIVISILVSALSFSARRFSSISEDTISTV